MAVTENPKIDIAITTPGKILEVVGVLSLLLFWYYTLSHYSQLPDIIPTHFGINNKVDGYGSKWMILTLPIVATVLYSGLTIAARAPHKMNYLVTITEANAAKQYSIVISMFRIMKIAIVIIFFLMAYETYQTAMGLPNVIGKWFLPLLFALIFVPLFYFMIKSSQNA